jgi:cytochrome c-type biogenesis protein CcmH
VRVLLALILILSLTAQVEPKTTLPDVEDEVMCVECRTALNVSTSPVADQERAFIRELIAQGKSKAEIKAALVDAYGPDVLATPEAKGFDLSAWAVPGLIVAALALTVVLVARRWRGRRTPDQGDTAADLDPADARRLDAELAAFDK